MPCEFRSRPGSIPQTFSPQTRETPLMAAPTAKCSQLFLAMSVEPRAPVNTGTFSLTFSPEPYSVSVLTAGKLAWSGSAGTPSGSPSAPNAYPMMFRWE